MKRCFLGSMCLLLLVCAEIAEAQDAKGVTAPQYKVTAGSEPAKLVVWNRPIVVFRATFASRTPKERAIGAAERIEQIPDISLGRPVRADLSRVGDAEGYLIFVDNYLAFGLVKEDLDPLAGKSLDEAAQEAAQRLREVLKARADQRSLPLLLRGLGLALVTTLLLLLVLWLTSRLRRRLSVWLDKPSKRFQFFELDLHNHVLAVEHRVLAILCWTIYLTASYLWLSYVLSLFPFTEPLGEALGDYLIATAKTLGSGVLEAVPGLGTVVIIFLVTRFASRLIGNLFQQIEMGHIEVSWLLPETARATRRLVIVMIWLFAVVVAYPYFPGSQSEAFKGLSVLIGLMVSLGSAGMVNQVMSGLVVLYSRAVRIGDYVRIGEIEGTVTELGALSTKVVNQRREEITIPNAVLVGTTTTNYSRLVDAEGAILTTSVTIGYDAAWRQVHAMLLLAAERTPGIHKSPRPRVVQKALADFYVEYILHFNIARPAERHAILSELHAQIQDVFNEFGVQIMSPHFEQQPHERIWVPKEKWHDAPAPTPTHDSTKPTSTLTETP